MSASSSRVKYFFILVALVGMPHLQAPSRGAEVLLSGFEFDLSTSIPGESWSVQPDLTAQVVSGIPGTSEGTGVLQIEHPEIWSGNTPWIQLDGAGVAEALSESTALKFDLIAPQDFAWRQAFVVVQGSPINWTQTQFDLTTPPDMPFTVEFDLTQEFQDSNGMTRPLNEIALDAFDEETDWFQLIIAFQGQNNLPLGTSITYLDNMRLVQPDVPAIDGDYNNDGNVDAADYVSWRKNVGAPAGTLPNDPTGVAIGGAQYDVWVQNFSASGAGAGGSLTAVVPEPATLGLMALLLVPLTTAVRGRR